MNTEEPTIDKILNHLVYNSAYEDVPDSKRQLLDYLLSLPELQVGQEFVPTDREGCIFCGFPFDGMKKIRQALTRAILGEGEVK